MPGIFEDEYYDILGKARHGRGFGVREAAERSGLTDEAIVRLEGGALRPDSELLASLAAVLGLSAPKLVRFAVSPAPPRAGEFREAVFRSLPGKGFSANGYVIGCPRQRACALVDPGLDLANIKGALKELELEAARILITHGHGDHTQGLASVASGLGVPASALSRERPLLGKTRVEYVEPGSSLQIGDLNLQFIDVPGHTPGGAVLYVAAAGVAFTGDVLFARSTGRPSVSGAAYEAFLSRIRETVLALPEETLLCPGHGPLTNVADERAHNPFFP